ncbi:MAG: hypothetical protein ABL998_03195 [Planctomycetota bacterium]
MSIRHFALLFPLLLAACQEDARPLLPRPTEHSLDPAAEADQKARRRAWFAHRHQAAPEVDWRELERANGEALIERRNRAPRALTVVSPWVERGSENVAGRVHTAALAPDGQALYAGTSLGGVWQGSLDGDGWTPFGDNLYGGGHHLAVIDGATSGAPDVVLVASEGGLVHVTGDFGATWQIPSGLGSLNNVRRTLVTSDGGGTVFLLRRGGSRWKLMRSTDAMASFQEVFDFNTFAGDAWITRDGRNELFIVTSTGVRKSTDLGASWTSVGAAPVSGTQAELTGSEAGAPRLWSVWKSGGQSKLYRSNDAGASWTFLSNLSDYWDVLNASLSDADLLLYGGVEAHRSVNAGSSFAVINTWGAYYGNPAARLHADIQGIDVVAGGPAGETWYISTDGGLYRSHDLLTSVENLSLTGLRISQYYSTHTSSANANHVVAGAQDQGYQRASSGAATSEPFNFNQLISGDYGHLTSGDGDHDFLFSCYPGFVLIQVGENNPGLFTEDFPAGEDHAWIPPIVADPLDARQFFLCASHLYRYVKGAGNNWTITQWSTFDFGVAAGEYVSALVFSPLDPQRAYAVTDRGRLYHSSDRGVSWTQSTSTGPSGQYFYGTALVASALDIDTVYVGGSGYSGPAVYRSSDGGATFQAWNTGMPATLVYCLAEARDGSGTIFAGTETSALKRAPGDAAWSDIAGSDAPITVYWSVEALAQENTMRFGTYGRGIFDYQLELQARATVRNGLGVNPSCLTNVTPPEIGGAWSVRIDPTVLAGTSAVSLVVRASATGGTVLGYGEPLVAGPKLFSASQPANAAGNVFSFPIPNDPGLVGLTASAQAVLLGGGLTLGNALDIVVGY